MQRQGIPDEPSERPCFSEEQRENDVMGRLLIGQARPWSVDEIAREIDELIEAVDAIAASADGPRAPPRGVRVPDAPRAARASREIGVAGSACSGSRWDAGRCLSASRRRGGPATVDPRARDPTLRAHDRQPALARARSRRPEPSQLLSRLSGGPVAPLWGCSGPTRCHVPPAAEKSAQTVHKQPTNSAETAHKLGALSRTVTFWP